MMRQSFAASALLAATAVARPTYLDRYERQRLEKSLYRMEEAWESLDASTAKTL